MKTIKIVSLILLVLISATYYHSIASRFDKHTFYSYKDIITGQEWEILKVNSKRIENPINVLDHMSDEEFKKYNELKNEIEELNTTMSDNQDAHDNYNNDQYTGGLTLDDLGVNGGNTLSDWEVTTMLHEEAIKQLQSQQDLYLDAENKTYDLKQKMDNLNYQLTNEAWDLRNTVNNVRVFTIIALLLVIFSKKLLRLSKKIFSFIIND